MSFNLFKFAVYKARGAFELNRHLGGFEEILLEEAKVLRRSTSLETETCRFRAPAQAFQGS